MQEDSILTTTYTLWLNLIYQSGLFLSVMCVLFGLVSMYGGVIYFRNMMSERGGNYSGMGVVVRILMGVMLMNMYTTINTTTETMFHGTGINYESTNPAAWNESKRAQSATSATEALKGLVFGALGLFGYFAMVMGTFTLPKLDKYHKEHEGWKTFGVMLLFFLGGILSINLQEVLIAIQPYLPFLRSFN